VVADAYYTLSDPVRRREYDLHVPSSSSFPSSFPDDPDAEPSFSSAPPPSASSTSSFFSNLFGAATGSGGAPAGHADAEATFTSVFADLLEPEVGRERHGRMWSLVGGAGGAACGFIVGNLPGAAAGGTSLPLCLQSTSQSDADLLLAFSSAFAGNRLGAIRDAKGKAVGEVFMTLGADRKAEVRLQSFRSPTAAPSD
jgi:curved DNA-binding protein CbpA